MDENNNEEDTVDVLSIFLREYKDKLEQGNLSREESINLTEFYIKSKFVEEKGEDDDDFDMKDFMKFVIMGWYVYGAIKNIENEL